MRSVNKKFLLISIIFGTILLAEIAIRHFQPNLTFINGNLTIANKILNSLAFFGLILSILIALRASKKLTIPLGIVFFLLFFINSCSEIFPIDTTTQPIDVSVLKTNENGSKLIIRERRNAKTDQLIRDTVLVNDKYIFRQIIERDNNSPNF